MTKGFSCYLDLVRIVAAAIVFFHHLALDSGCYAGLGNGCATLAMLVPFHAGHTAVVLFFVLSGYVITYVANERETTLPAFALSRLARIYSVAIPVLLLVAAIDGLSYATGHRSDLPLYQYGKIWIYLPLILAFATDHWFLAENAFSLGAWWSVAYEVWYYVLFAAAFFLRGWHRWAVSLVVVAAMGPKLLALFPLWLLGSLVYVVHSRAGIRRIPGAPLLFGLTVAALVAILATSAILPVDRWADAQSGGWITGRLRFSQWFAGDALVALVFGANVLLARYVSLRFGAATWLIRGCAAYTFTFYMVHGPFLKVFAANVSNSLPLATIAVVAFTLVFGQVTERQKDRLRLWLAWAATKMTGMKPTRSTT